MTLDEVKAQIEDVRKEVAEILTNLKGKKPKAEAMTQQPTHGTSWMQDASEKYNAAVEAEYAREKASAAASPAPVAPVDPKLPSRLITLD